MSTMTALPKDDPRMLAWEAYRTTPEYADSRNWAKRDEHLDGSMWAAFIAGFHAAQPAAAPEALSKRPAIDALEIPQDVMDEVVAALNRAIGLATRKAPGLAAGFTETAVRLDEAINDAMAEEA